MSDENPKRIAVGDAGHHVPAVRKSKGRAFEISRSDKTRPTIFPKGDDIGHLHWRLHEAEREYVVARQGDFSARTRNFSTHTERHTDRSTTSWLMSNRLTKVLF